MGVELVKTWHDLVRAFKIPKKPTDIKMWRDVQIAFWTFWSLLTSVFVLPLLIQLVAVLKR